MPELLSVTAAAARAEVAASTWRAYVTRGQAPPPDAYEADRPRWRVDTVDAWLAHRPGKGRQPRCKEARMLIYVDVPDLTNGSRAADHGYPYGASATTNAWGTEYQLYNLSRAWVLHDDLRAVGYRPDAPTDSKGRALARGA